MTTKAAVVIDKWKLAIFERHLSRNGFAFKNAGDLTGDTYVLHVDTGDPTALEIVVRAANAEASHDAARSKT